MMKKINICLVTVGFIIGFNIGIKLSRFDRPKLSDLYKPFVPKSREYYIANDVFYGMFFGGMSSFIIHKTI